MITAVQIAPTEILNAFSRSGILIALGLGISEVNTSTVLEITMQRNGRSDAELLDAVASQTLADLVDFARPHGGCIMMELSDWPKIEIDDIGAHMTVEAFVRPYAVRDF